MKGTTTRDMVESSLTRHFRSDRCVVTGRGSAAIYLLLKALGVKGKEVVFPALICPSVVYAILKAGATPVACDSSLKDYNMSLEGLKRRVGADTGAVIANHLFGHPLSAEIIGFLSSLSGVAVIEDIAQAPYLVTDIPIKVMSFGRTKPVCADGGGAILCRDPSLAREARGMESSLPIPPDDINAHSSIHKEMFKLFYRYLESGQPKGKEALAFLPDFFSPLFFHKASEGTLDKIDRAIDFDRLKGEYEERRRKAGLYRKLLDMEGITHPVCPEETVYYRYSVLADDLQSRDKLADRLRLEGIHASSLYDSLHVVNANGGSCPNSKEISSRVINLWTDEEADEAYIQKTAAVFKGVPG